jgi:hypothetical protein
LTGGTGERPYMESGTDLMSAPPRSPHSVTVRFDHLYFDLGSASIATPQISAAVRIDRDVSVQRQHRARLPLTTGSGPGSGSGSPRFLSERQP